MDEKQLQALANELGRRATSPIEERLWHSGKLCLFARGSPTRGAGAKRLRGWMKGCLTVGPCNDGVVYTAAKPTLSKT